MQSIDEITNYLKANLSEKRFRHIIGVAETARALAQKWGADADKAFLAGLVHDCAKEIPVNKAVERLTASGYSPDEVELRSPALLHAPLGAVVAREVFGISDKEVLNAVTFHTTGRPEMSLLEKIIYVADFTEPGRTYPEAGEIRQLSYIDINRAVLKETDMVIKFTVDRGRAIHPATVITRNYYLKLINEENKNEN
jgi:predicted HD superfamily hydrolase involved in NAD metabolism